MEHLCRILFAGSAEFSMPTLRALHECGLVCAVLSTPDQPCGRGRRVRANCVAAFARSEGLPLITPQSLKAEAREAVARFAPQLMISVAYGKIFGPRFLDLFKRGAFNVHPSLLPRFRGPAPVPASILAGDVVTGVTLQRMALGMDEGDVLLQTTRRITDDDDSGSLLEDLAKAGAVDVMNFIDNEEDVCAVAMKQDDAEAVYCTKLSPAYGRIGWNESAHGMVRIARAFSKPYWGAHACYKPMDREAQMLKLWRMHVVDSDVTLEPPGTVVGSDPQHGILIQTVRGVVGCTELQLPNRARLFWEDFVHGEPAILHTRLC